MKITVVDRLATSNASFLHRADVRVKLLFLLAIIAVTVLVWNPYILGAVVVGLLSIALMGKLPLKIVTSLAAYSLLFTLVFALSTQPGLLVGSAIVLKGLCGALASILVVLSTPYPLIFALTGKFLPRLLNDALLLTYRTIFLLADTLTDLMRALHLRGSFDWHHPLVALKMLASALGNLVLFALTLAEQDYDILRMRGYEGRIVVTPGSYRKDSNQ